MIESTFCPDHGKKDMIAFSSDAMWHPSTGELKPEPYMMYCCRHIIKTRRFLFWKWDVRCRYSLKVKGAS